MTPDRSETPQAEARSSESVPEPEPPTRNAAETVERRGAGTRPLPEEPPARAGWEETDLRNAALELDGPDDAMARRYISDIREEMIARGEDFDAVARRVGLNPVDFRSIPDVEETGAGPFRYALRYRPPGHATVPQGYTRFDRTPSPDAPFGTVDYAQRLPDDVVRQFELRRMGQTPEARVAEGRLRAAEAEGRAQRAARETADRAARERDAVEERRRQEEAAVEAERQRTEAALPE